MYVLNPPSDTALRDSIEKILHVSFSDHAYHARTYSKLYLVDGIQNIQTLGEYLKHIAPSTAGIAVNTLSLTVATELRRQQTWLQNQGVQVISDYSNPYYTQQDKRIFFYSSTICRPLISHIYKELYARLSPLTQKYKAAITPIGSDLLPDFPCKLDVDILICIANKKDYLSFCRTLKEMGLFIAPPRITGESHIFFYAELLGAPIDLHVYNSALKQCPIYKQTQQLQNDPTLQNTYRQFKIKNQGIKADEYRTAKAAFRQKIGWVS